MFLQSVRFSTEQQARDYLNAAGYVFLAATTYQPERFVDSLLRRASIEIIENAAIVHRHA